MPSLTFKQKLVVSMMVVVGGITLALLAIAERKLQAAYEERFRQEFNSAFALFNARQEARLGALKDGAGELASAVRFTSLLEEVVREPDKDTIEILNQVVTDEIKKAGGAGRRRGGVPFFRLYDPQGKLITETVNDPTLADLENQLKRVEKAVMNPAQTELGYIRMRHTTGEDKLYEILLSKCNDSEANVVRGTLLFGVPFRTEEQPEESLYGLWVEGRMHIDGLPGETESVIRAIVDQATEMEGRTNVTASGVPYQLFYRQMNPGSDFPPAYQVSLQPLGALQEEKKDLRKQIAGAGLLAFVAALAISLVLAGGLTAPINALVQGAHQIEKGQFDLRLPIHSRDEVGRLTESFNEMAAGLLLREKYRSVLDMVADKKIAEDLINGAIELGGEEREVAVLFCDIRGFTALSERMEPKEVIEMLNQHFTPLTRIVYEHHGAVDKFVGDLIMAIFGAPKSFGNDIENAARCALRMVEEREALNISGEYKISIGIGVASGKVVAGRMGSKDRLNYTVLGPRVNLASRLCGQAGPMEVVVDDETWRRVEAVAEGSATPELRLKGFAQPVQAYKLRSIQSQNERETHEAVAV